MSSPAQLGTHRSLSQEKIDHLMSVPIPSTTLQLDQLHVDRPYQPPRAPSLTSSKGAARYDSPQWSPLHLRTYFILGNVVILLGLALVVELLYFLNNRSHGWAPTHFLLTHPGFAPYLTVLPALLVWALLQPWAEIDRLVKLVQPYVNMSASRTLAGDSVMLNYADRRGVFLLPKLVRNRHITPLLTTGICILAVLITPFSAAYIRMTSAPDNAFVHMQGVRQVEQLSMPYTLPLAGLNAAASYASAAASLDVAPPKLVLYNGGLSWAAANVIYGDPASGGTVKVNTVVVQSSAQCQIATGVSFSDGVLSGVGWGCSFHVNTTDANTGYMSWTDTPSAFGMSTVVCSSTSISSIAPVIFWELYSNGDQQREVLATSCIPQVVSYRGDVLMNATNSAVLAVENLGPLNNADLVGLNLTGEVTNGQIIGWASPLNNTALNGLFLDYTIGADINILQYMHTSLGTAIDTQLRTNLDSGFGFGYIGAHLDACELAYGNFLGLAARQIYFSSIDGLDTKGSYHSTAQRLFISSSIAHTLFVMLILMAMMGLTVLQRHRIASQTLRLHVEPGSLASAVACAAASDLPAILRSSDTKADMKSILQEYTFTLNPSTGGLVIGDRDPATMPSPTHIPMTGAASWMKKKFNHHSSTGASA